MPRFITLEEARAAKAKAARLLADPYVVGVGLTRGKGGGYAVKVNVNRHAGDPIPESLDGVPIIKDVVGVVLKR